MAHRSGKKATSINRDSQPKYLGVKLFDGEHARIGSILVRQRGTRFMAGKNVREGGDNTLYATAQGKVKFQTRSLRAFTGLKRPKKIVNVVPALA